MIAVKDNRLVIAERLLDMGADVNAVAKVIIATLLLLYAVFVDLNRFWLTLLHVFIIASSYFFHTHVLLFILLCLVHYSLHCFTHCS